MIDAVVEEELTTRRQNTSVQVMLHKHKYTMELIKTSEYFKPGLKYTAFVSMCTMTDKRTHLTKRHPCASYYASFAVEINVSRWVAGARYEKSRAHSVRIHVQSSGIFQSYTHVRRTRHGAAGLLSAQIDGQHFFSSEYRGETTVNLTS